VDHSLWHVYLYKQQNETSAGGAHPVLGVVLLQRMPLAFQESSALCCIEAGLQSYAFLHLLLYTLLCLKDGPPILRG
jgi:hypothetical protein